MKNRWSLKGQNRGASLIAVMAAITFVSVIGIVISQITITNIQMKQMEQEGKTNFYNAEAVLDDLAAGLNSKAAGAMQEAYTDMLAKYRTVTASGGNVQQTFSRMYLDNLIALFQAPKEGANDPLQKKDGVDADAKVTYEIGYYSIHSIKKSFSTKKPAEPAPAPAPGETPAPTPTPAPGAEENYLYEDCLKTAAAIGTDSASFYRADYEAGTFVLEGILITAKDEQTGYETTIRTDIVFDTPELNFESNNLVKDFMRYSLIADHAINVNAPNVTVKGNAYAGENGIYSATSSASGSFQGSTIVTRGDIYVSSGTTLTVGNTELTSKIYAENVRTVNTGSSDAASTLNLQGTSYISDDLELDGKNSIVNLKGSYYGYNFRKNYSAAGADVSSQYSSAIVINGRSAKLNMEELKYLLLAGRTYIARNGGAADVPLGESVSVRSNQMAYYVPDVFLDTTDPANVVFQDSTGGMVSNYLKVANIYDYVSSSSPVTAYNYTGPAGSDTVYYLKFSSEQSGNDFFAEYYANNKDQVNDYAENYLASDALKIGSGMIYTLKGDLMYRDGTDLNEERIVITNNYWNTDGIYFDYASSLGVTYKSLQTYLEEKHSGITPADIRFGDNNDKTQDRLIDNLIDMARLRDVLSSETDQKREIDCSRDGKEYKVVLIDNAGREPYQVPVSTRGGLIVATGDVEVYTGAVDTNNQFSGLIIAGGEIRFATNASVESNEALVSQLFAEDVRSGSSRFAFLFKGYDLNESSMGEVSIDKYMTYDNWSKTIE